MGQLSDFSFFLVVQHEMSIELLTDPESLPADVKPAVPAHARQTAEAVDWQINFRLAAWTAGTVLALSGLLFGWYTIQVHRQAASILARARTLHEQGNYKSAATAFHQYLQLEPANAEALLLRAKNFDKLPGQAEQKQQAVSLFFQAIQANPDQHIVRSRLAELLLETRRYDEAAEQARQVIAGLPDDVRAARVLAGALREQLGAARNVTALEVINTYREALARHKGDVPLTLGLANLLRKGGDKLPIELRDSAIPMADQAIDEMVEQHPSDIAALLARSRYRLIYRLPGAEEDLDSARQIAPDNPDVLLASAIAAGDSRRDAAREYGERLLEIASKSRQAYLTVASLYSRWNEPWEAIRVLETCAEKIGSDDLEVNRQLLQLLLTVGDADRARETLARVEPAFHRAEPYLPDPIRRRFNEDLELARTQFLVLEGKIAEAIPALKRLAASVTESADPAETLAERQRRWRLLAGVYAREGSHDRAAAAYDELVRLDPRSKPNHLLAAAEWRTIGDLDRALKHYEVAAAGEPDLPAAWLGLAETRLDLQLRRTTGETRDWSGVDAALKHLQTQLGDAPPVLHLRAVAALARADRTGALALLRKLAGLEKLEIALLPRLATLFEEAGATQDADATLERYRRRGGNAEIAVLTNAELQRRRGDSAAAIRSLGPALTHASDAARPSILRQLVSFEIDSGSIQSARNRLRTERTAGSTDLWVYETSIDLALMAQDAADLQECGKQLESIEGQGGTLWRFVQAVHLLETDSDVQNATRLATRLAGEIETLRPTWPQARLLRGRIAERMGRAGDAAENYEQALRAGARSLTTYQWLVAALYRQNRFADAAAYIGQSGQMAALTDELESHAIPANLRAGHNRDALKVARAAAELRSADPIAQVWYAQTLAMTGNPEAGEALLRRTLENSPKDARAWSALVWLQAHLHRLSEARQTLQSFAAAVATDQRDRELVLARGFDVIGDQREAERHYRQALAGNEKEVHLLEELGRFYVRVDHDRALEIYQQILAIDPKSAEARRTAAVLLGLRGTDADWSRGLALLTETDKATATDDRRIQATLLIVRGGPDNTREAVRLLSELVGKHDVARPGDRLLLARAYEELEQPEDARRQFELAVKSLDAPAFLTLYIDFLTRHNMLDEAGRMLSRLEEKDSANPKTLELRVDWLNASKRTNEIEPLIDRFLTARLGTARTAADKAAPLRAAADLCTRVHLDQAAEKKLRQLTSLVPTSYDVLALWLAEHQRADEALALALGKAVATNPVGAAIVVRVLTVAANQEQSPAKTSQADQVLLAAAKSPTASVPFLLELGVLRVMQGRNPEAIALYEQALKSEPENPAILNNLALVLSEIPERRSDALRAIEKAVGGLPNSMELIDSKALVLINAGRFQEAHGMLDRLCRLNRKNPRYRLHLAIALHHLDEQDKSRGEVEQAVENGLSKELLTPSERREWRKITGQVANR